MRLVILGREPLNQLEGWAKQYFSPVPVRKMAREASLPLPPLFQSSQLPLDIRIEPIKQIRLLSFNFEIPGQLARWDSKATDLIGHFLGHEGKGSLLSYLKSQNWVTQLSAGEMGKHWQFGIFSVTIELTPKGMDHLPEITEAFFAYRQLILAQANPRDYYRELETLAKLRFHFREKISPDSFVTSLASEMQSIPAPKALVAPADFGSYPKKEVQKLWEAIRPEKMIRILTAPGVEVDQVEPYYQAPYASGPLPPKELRRLRKPQRLAALQVPSLNPFLPKDTNLRPRQGSASEPALLVDQPGSRLWYRQDDHFKTPKVQLRIFLTSPWAYATPKEAALVRIWTQLVQESLNEYAYPAQMAGLKYSFENEVKGFEIQLEGYPDQLPLLLNRLLAQLKDPALSETKFNIFKQALQEERANQSKLQAYRRAYYEAQYLVTQKLWHHRDYLAVLPDLKLADLNKLLPKLLHNLQIDSLMSGNLTAKEAKKLQNKILQGLRAKPLKNFANLIERGILLQPGEQLRQRMQVEDVNSAIFLYFQDGAETPKNDALLGLIGLLIQQPFYTELRTRQQLGYVVWSSKSSFLRLNGFQFVIQSSSANPKKLTQRILAFLQTFGVKLQQMSNDEFDTFRQALIKKLNESPQNLAEEAGRDWSRIKRGTYDFNFIPAQLAALKKLTLEETRLFYEQLFLGAQAKSISVEAWGKNHPFSGQSLKVKQVKATHEFYPPLQP